MRVSKYCKMCRRLSEFDGNDKADNSVFLTASTPIQSLSALSPGVEGGQTRPQRLNLEDLYPGIKEYCKKHDCCYSEAIKKWEKG